MSSSVEFKNDFRSCNKTIKHGFRVLTFAKRECDNIL